MTTRTRWTRTMAAAMATLTLVAPGLAAAGSRTYTLDADFDQGALSGVNHDVVHNQLQLNAVGTTFPTLWIANAGEDTVTRFETAPGNSPVDNKETARYKTWFTGTPGFATHLGNPFAGAAPSRTAVDIDGNAYVLNRHFDGRVPVLLKILNEGGIDRNGNSTIDTSTSPGDIKPLNDTNPANAIIDVAELQDERIAWTTRFPNEAGQLGRALCIDGDGNLWVGTFNNGHLYKVRSSDGAILAGPFTVNATPYGCLVDQNDILWLATLSGNLGKFDTNTNAFTTFFHGGQNYSIALGKKDQLGPGTGSRIYLANLSGSFIEFNPLTNTFRFGPAIPGGGVGIGVNVDGNGDVLIGRHIGGGVTKFRPTLAGFTQIWTAPSQVNSETRGVIVDSNNDAWQVNFTNNLSKYRGTDGAALGLFPVGNTPYTYSDAAGFSIRNVTNQTGTWTVIQDGALAGTPWGTVSFTGNTPTGTSIQVQVRTADTQGGLSLQAFTAVGNGTPFNKQGRFIEIQARLNANTAGTSPILFDLTVSSNTCDVNKDGKIDRSDIALITAARNTSASGFGDPRDADGNGSITVNDARACTLKCTKPNCLP